MKCDTMLDIKLIESEIVNMGLYCRSHRFIGESFVEFEIVLCSGCDFRRVIHRLKDIGFWEVRLDGDDYDALTATIGSY